MAGLRERGGLRCCGLGLFGGLGRRRLDRRGRGLGVRLGRRIRRGGRVSLGLVSSPGFSSLPGFVSPAGLPPVGSSIPGWVFPAGGWAPVGSITTC